MTDPGVSLVDVLEGVQKVDPALVSLNAAFLSLQREVI